MSESVASNAAAISDDLVVAHSDMSDAERTIDRLKSGKNNVWSSMEAASFDDRKKILSATLNAEPLQDHIGETISLRHIIVQPVELVDDQTGEVSVAMRAILVPESGTSLYAISDGLMRSLDTVIGLLGEPKTWDGPVDIRVDRIKGKRGHYYTVSLA